MTSHDAENARALGLPVITYHPLVSPPTVRPARPRDAPGCVTMEFTSARRRPEAHPFYRALGYQDWCPNSARYVKDLVRGASASS